MEWEDFNENDINWPIKKGEKVYHYLYGWGEVTDYYICNVRWFNPIGTTLNGGGNWREDIKIELSKTKYTKLEDLPSLSKEEYSKKMNSLLNEEGREKEARNEEYLKNVEIVKV